ncbi:MAG: EamA family transporter [Candidatus Binatia bacterium]
MAEYFAIQASVCFAISHILIRRGLVASNAITGSFISLSMSAIILWLMVSFFVPLSSFRTSAVWYFIVAGIFAPGIGRILSYVAIERIGVARSVPVVNSSPMFASILAVFLVGETWTFQNFLGTTFVILGVVILSRSQPEQKQWRLEDMVYALLAALSFGISGNLRKLGLLAENLPLMATAVTSTTGLFLPPSCSEQEGDAEYCSFRAAASAGSLQPGWPIPPLWSRFSMP